MDKTKPISRRVWLKKATLLSTALVVTPLLNLSTAGAATQKKATQASVHYRGHPDGMKMCSMCKYFIPHGATAGRGMMGMMGRMGPGMMTGGRCQLVQGQISPMGYCDLYTPT